MTGGIAMTKKQGSKGIVFNGGFRRGYESTFQENPFAANFHLLLCERGREIFDKPFPDLATSRLIVSWGKDLKGYRLPREAKR